MRILVVDDEPLARQRLIHQLKVDKDYQVVGEAVNGQDAIDKTTSLNPDLLLMDIRMPGMDGLEAARHIDLMDSPPAIIFTTAYNEYALEAFDVHAIGYLVKPVRLEKLIKAIASASRPNLAALTEVKSEVDKNSARKFISASVRGNIELIPLNEIYYFHAEHKYVDVRHAKGKLLIEEPLKKLEAEFGHLFLRVHRNALVARKFLAGFSKNNQGHWRVTFQDIEDSLEVSRRHTANVRKVIKNL